MRKSLPKSEEFEIEDTVKEGSAEYYLKKAKYFFQTTEKLFKAEKITEDDFNHSKKSYEKIQKLYDEYKKDESQKSNLVWAVAKYSSAVLYLEDGGGRKDLLSW